MYSIHRYCLILEFHLINFHNIILQIQTNSKILKSLKFAIMSKDLAIAFKRSTKKSAISQRKSRLREMYFGSYDSSQERVDDHIAEENFDAALESSNNEETSSFSALSNSIATQSDQIMVSDRIPSDPFPELSSSDVTDDMGSPSLSYEIREWTIRCNIRRTHLDQLLRILRPRFIDLPVCYKTLLETPRNLKVYFLFFYIK